MQRLPIGIDDFRELREGGYAYVDKTRLIYELIHTAKFIFLSRPRRFGKSLLTTTLRELFLGNAALFEGLWIADQIEWTPYSVILLNFNDLDYRTKSLADALAEEMDKQARLHGMTLDSAEYKGKFLGLIERLAERSKVVLLVDEYDKPITDLLENSEKVAEHIDTLKNFYAVLHYRTENVF
ncbi:MAG: AAA family ATPase [Caldilineaceae bacterium]